MANDTAPKICLILERSGERKELIFKLQNSFLARLWLKELKKLLQHRFFLHKEFWQLGWPESDRSFSVIRQELKAHWETLGKYRPLGELPPFPAREDESLWQKNFFNPLHRQFELMHGIADEPNGFFLSIPAEARYAVLQLNHLCHEAESLLRARNAQAQNAHVSRANWIYSFANRPRRTLDPAWMPAPSWNRHFGRIYLHWSEIGKTPWEFLYDEDRHIGEEKILGHLHLSGEFDVEWGHDTESDPLWQKNLIRLRQHLEQHAHPGFHGWYEVAHWDENSAPLPDPQEFRRTMAQGWNPIQIVIHEGKDLCQGDFPLRWSDAAYKSTALRAQTWDFRKKWALEHRLPLVTPAVSWLQNLQNTSLQRNS